MPASGDLPLFAKQVSGEYGLLDFERAIRDTITSIRRAGADVVVSYYARVLLRIHGNISSGT